MEKWKRIYIENEETKYEISSLGRCRNTTRLDWKTEGVLKPKYNKQNGYETYCIVMNSINHYKYVHRLVAEAFIEGDTELHVNHIDGEKRNNIATNLEWVTQKENMRHAFDNDLVSTVKPVKQFSLRGKYIKTYKSISDASRATGIHFSSISTCVLGDSASAGRFQWKYVSENVTHTSDIKDTTVQYNVGVVKLSKENNYIKEYKSITEAYKEIGKTDNGTISAVCKNKRNTYAGFKWMYRDEYYEKLAQMKI